LYEVKKHLLHKDGAAVRFVNSPNGGSTVRPLYLIMHYTAGTTASGAIAWFENPAAKASAHLVIDRDGAVTQMRAFNRSTWHAGKSSWNELEGMNAFSLGIELVNAGKLKKTDAGEWVNWAGNRIPAAEVIVATHKHETSPAGWHIYTPEQIATVTEVGLALHAAYGFLDVLGHEDISPGRKVDPGPAFPLLSIQSRIMGRA
jgi:N-acetylmuramoyl-L-alanine amidase